MAKTEIPASLSSLILDVKNALARFEGKTLSKTSPDIKNRSGLLDSAKFTISEKFLLISSFRSRARERLGILKLLSRCISAQCTIWMDAISQSTETDRVL